MSTSSTPEGEQQDLGKYEQLVGHFPCFKADPLVRDAFFLTVKVQLESNPNRKLCSEPDTCKRCRYELGTKCDICQSPVSHGHENGFARVFPLFMSRLTLADDSPHQQVVHMELGTYCSADCARQRLKAEFGKRIRDDEDFQSSLIFHIFMTFISCSLVYQLPGTYPSAAQLLVWPYTWSLVLSAVYYTVSLCGHFYSWCAPDVKVVSIYKFMSMLCSMALTASLGAVTYYGINFPTYYANLMARDVHYLMPILQVLIYTFPATIILFELYSYRQMKPDPSHEFFTSCVGVPLAYCACVLLCYFLAGQPSPFLSALFTFSPILGCVVLPVCAFAFGVGSVAVARLLRRCHWGPGEII